MFPESVLLLPWLVVLLLDIQLLLCLIMPPLQISGQPRLPTVIFPAALFSRDTKQLLHAEHVSSCLHSQQLPNSLVGDLGTRNSFYDVALVS